MWLQGLQYLIWFYARVITKILNTKFKYKTRKCSQINLITVCLYPLSIQKAVIRLFIFRRKKGSSPSLLGNRGLTWGVTLIEPRLCVHNTPKIQHRGRQHEPQASFVKDRRPSLPTPQPLTQEIWTLQSRTKAYSRITVTSCISETTHMFTIAITW